MAVHERAACWMDSPLKEARCSMQRLMRWSFVVLGVLVLTGIVLWWVSRPAGPDAFYTPPASSKPQNVPGQLLRQEVLERGVPSSARAWRILYTTTDTFGKPAVASAVVMAARSAQEGPLPVVAWAHGTTGVVPGCAPSLLEDPFAHVPALPQLLEHGWLYVATDYTGLGTAGPHPYLIGSGQARAVLDAVRAARGMHHVRAGAK